MMKKLILHVGPAKCGSSTIQDFFKNNIHMFKKDILYKMLDPVLIKKLNYHIPKSSDITLLKSYVTKSEVLILSHEFLFQNPYAIKNICTFFERIVSDIIIVGYSRRQSNFLVSAYSQWLFRSVDRVKEIGKVLEKFGIEQNLFSGLEKQIIASIYDDFHSARQLSEYNILDWYNGYSNFSKLLFSENIKIKVGVLPNKQFQFNLVEDFCTKSEIKLPDNLQKLTLKRTNKSFDNNLVDSLNCAIAYGFNVVGPHEANESLQNISENFKDETVLSVFLEKLLIYIDSYHFKKNINFCNKYKLEPKYFEVENRIDKLTILKLIKDEEINRIANPLVIVEKYRRLCGELAKVCVDLQIKLDKR